MATGLSIGGRIGKPVAEVFEAVADPQRLSRYFTTGGAQGRIEPGAIVTWDFHDFPGAFPVEVVEVERDRRIVLRWDAQGETAPADATGRRRTTVTFTFEPVGADRTLVRIGEEGWLDTDAGRTAALGNCEGWTGMLCAMKAWLEHGINLREGFYK